MKRIWLFLCLAMLFAVPARALKAMDIPENAAEVKLELRSLSEGDAQALAELLLAHPAVRVCDLTSAAVPVSTAKILMEECPDISFHLTLDLYGGITLDNFRTALDMDATKSKNGTRLSKRLKLGDLRSLLDCMPLLEEVVMTEAQHPLSDMKALIADYPRIRFSWTVRENGMTFRPGATAYSTLKGRQEPRYKAEDLALVQEYCPDLLALDVGHNDVSDLSFLKAWPKLRRLIVIDSKTPLTDLSPLADLEDLEYVELFMQNITDISPLAGKTKLLDLNLCHNDIADLSPLYSCVNLERLWISVNPHLTKEEIARFREALPNCRVETEDWRSTGAGWRNHPRYTVMYNSFVTGVYEPFDPAP